MNNKKILLADNKPRFIKSHKELLENAGYQVRVAENPEIAKAILEEGKIDLAILDIRLRDDKDDFDKSGLELAKNYAPSIPKILLTGFPSWELVREALGADADGLPPAVDFISKKEGIKVLLLAVEWTLRQPILKKNILSTFNVDYMMALPERFDDLGPEVAAEHLKESFDVTLKQLMDYQDDEFRRASRYHKWALAWALVGIVIIFGGVVLSFLNMLSSTLLPTISGVILEAIGVLFFVREDAAHNQVNAYYVRLDEVSKLSNILTICETIRSDELREVYKLKIIDKILEKWFGSRYQQT